MCLITQTTNSLSRTWLKRLLRYIAVHCTSFSDHFVGMLLSVCEKLMEGGREGGWEEYFYEDGEGGVPRCVCFPDVMGRQETLFCDF